MNTKVNQDQSATEGSVAIQAGGHVTVVQNNGVTYEQARQIACDVVRLEFQHLSEEARDQADRLTEKIREEFFDKLAKENPEGVKQAASVDFQYALHSVQRDYARSADDDLGSLLVDLLVDRSKEVERNLTQIVLNEALATAPKLTSAQIAALGLIFLFRYLTIGGIISIDTFNGSLDRYAKPFGEGFQIKDSAFQHLEFTGCGKISLGQIKLGDALLRTYKGVFTKGFEYKEISDRGLTDEEIRNFTCRALRDNDHFQINVMNDQILEGKLTQFRTIPERAVIIRDLWGKGVFSEEEVKSAITSARPYMEGIFKAWDESAMKRFDLTSVGIAIGHASIKRYAGEFADLSIWFN